MRYIFDPLPCGRIGYPNCKFINCIFNDHKKSGDYNLCEIFIHFSMRDFIKLLCPHGLGDLNYDEIIDQNRFIMDFLNKKMPSVIAKQLQGSNRTTVRVQVGSYHSFLLNIDRLYDYNKLLSSLLSSDWKGKLLMIN